MNTHRAVTPLLLAGAGVALGAWYLRRRQRMDFDGASVVITGARGLALEIARLLAVEGARLTLLARDEMELARARDELEDLGAEVLIDACDIREAAETQRAIERALDHFGRVDVLINNAGIISVGPVEHMDLDDYEDNMAVHYWGPLYLMQDLLPYMKKQGGGRIVNIASIGGLVAVPHIVPYCASKFALVGLSDGLRAELAKDNIQVTTVCPGLMRTGSHFNALFKGRQPLEFAWFTLGNALPPLSIQSKRAARQIVEACRFGDPFLVITLPARALHLANVLLPRVTAGVMKLTARLLPPPAGLAGNQRKTGLESRSGLAPSWVTQLSDRAAVRNNELP